MPNGEACARQTRSAAVHGRSKLPIRRELGILTLVLFGLAAAADGSHSACQPNTYALISPGLILAGHVSGKAGNMKGLSLLIVLMLMVGAELLASRLKHAGSLPAQNHHESASPVSQAQPRSTYRI